MKMFQTNLKYKLKVKQKGKITIYTALVIDEDELFVKFKDKNGEEITLKKENISESKCL